MSLSPSVVGLQVHRLEEEQILSDHLEEMSLFFSCGLSVRNTNVLISISHHPINFSPAHSIKILPDGNTEAESLYSTDDH